MRIDVHHHFFPQSINKEKLNEDVGWITPTGHLPWTSQVSLGLMDAAGIDIAILSLPALGMGEIGAENRKLARQMNGFLHQVRQEHPKRFGFFATVPFFDDVEGVIEEIKYAIDHLNADGIALSSSYGTGSSAKYVAHDHYDAIWAELDRRGTVVFLHGAQTPSSTPYPHPALGIPVSEVPNETYKAAAQLVVSGRKRKYPNVKIILAHMGGNTINLAPRVAALSSYMGCSLSAEEIIADFKTFYFDTALSVSETNLLAVENFAGLDRVLYGSDFPAVDLNTVKWNSSNLEKFYENAQDKLNTILIDNAFKLFPRLKEIIPVV